MLTATETWYGRLDDTQIAEVTVLVEEAAEADGVPPLSEHVMLHLRYGGDVTSANLLQRDLSGVLVGYAHLDDTDPVAGPSGELVIEPGHRHEGAGTALVAALSARGGDRLRLWAHGHQPAAAALAARTGFHRTRVLWQLRRSLHAPLPAPSWPAGVTLRSFVPGRDEQAWIEVNTRAFVHHPEQGRWTVEDLLLREAEPWFDPAGFFLAERAGALVGFHWTKVHGAGRSNGHPHPAIGEVYVVGVDPAAQGTGLGEALTLHGLRHLRSLGLAQVLLYVDDDNPRAVALYERLGFLRWDSDVTYTRAGSGAGAAGASALLAEEGDTLAGH